MPKIVNSGVPSKHAGGTATNGATLADALTAATPPVESFASLVSKMLAEQNSAAVIVIDPNSRKVTTATGAQAEVLRDAVEDARSESVELAPDPGQTGRSLLWTKGDGYEALTGTNQSAIDSAIEPVRPRRSAESMVSAILAQELGEKAPILVVDQVNGNILFAEVADPTALQTALDAAKAGDQATIALSDESPGETAPKLVFEGGSV